MRWPVRSVSRAARVSRSSKSTGTKNGARDIVLVDVELLEQGAERPAPAWKGVRDWHGLRAKSPLISARQCTGLHPYLCHGRSGSSTLRSRGFEQLRQVFPEEFAAVDDFAGAHVEEVDGERAVFKVIAEDVGVVVLLGGGDALLFLELVHGGELVAQARGGLELLGFGGGHHARGERALQFGVAAFEKELRVADGAFVDLRAW